MIKLLRHLFLDDFQLKLFSLVLALLFWLTVSSAIRQKEVSPSTGASLFTMVRVFTNLPVGVLSSSADVRSYKVNPSRVDVTVQGDPRALSSLRGDEIRVWVDLTNIEGSRNLSRRMDVSTPTGIAHLSVRPEEVQVMVPGKPLQR
jgi:YbbR domain-containing protein